MYNIPFCGHRNFGGGFFFLCLLNIMRAIICQRRGAARRLDRFLTHVH